MVEGEVEIRLVPQQDAADLRSCPLSRRDIISVSSTVVMFVFVCC